MSLFPRVQENNKFPFTITKGLKIKEKLVKKRKKKKLMIDKFIM